MTKAEYLEQLKYRLRVLPGGELQDALEYYDGYLSDAGNEAAAIAQLGTPGEVAANILANYVAKTPPHEAGPATAKTGGPRGGVKTAWVIILAIFALPIGFPIIIAVAAAGFSLFVALLSVVLAVGASGAAFLAGGLAGLLAVPFVVTQDFGFALLSGGMGLVSLGLGILLIKFIAVLMRGFPMISRFVAKKAVRRNHHGR